MFGTLGNDIIITTVNTVIVIITDQPEACTWEASTVTRDLQRTHVGTLNQSFHLSRFDK